MTLIKLLIMGRSYFYTDFLLDLTPCKCWPLREKKAFFRRDAGSFTLLLIVVLVGLCWERRRVR